MRKRFFEVFLMAVSSLFLVVACEQPNDEPKDPTTDPNTKPEPEVVFNNTCASIAVSDITVDDAKVTLSGVDGKLANFYVGCIAAADSEFGETPSEANDKIVEKLLAKDYGNLTKPDNRRVYNGVSEVNLKNGEWGLKEETEYIVYVVGLDDKAMLTHHAVVSSKFKMAKAEKPEEPEPDPEPETPALVCEALNEVLVESHNIVFELKNPAADLGNYYVECASNDAFVAKYGADEKIACLAVYDAALQANVDLTTVDNKKVFNGVQEISMSEIGCEVLPNTGYTIVVIGLAEDGSVSHSALIYHIISAQLGYTIELVEDKITANGATVIVTPEAGQTLDYFVGVCTKEKYEGDYSDNLINALTLLAIDYVDCTDGVITMDGKYVFAGLQEIDLAASYELEPNTEYKVIVGSIAYFFGYYMPMSAVTAVDFTTFAE